MASALVASAPALFADDDGPPARFVASPDAVPLAAPGNATNPTRQRGEFGQPTPARAADQDGPSLGNEWTSAKSKSSRQDSSPSSSRGVWESSEGSAPRGGAEGTVGNTLRAVPSKPEFASQGQSSLKPTSGNLAWRPRDTALSKAQAPQFAADASAPARFAKSEIDQPGPRALLPFERQVSEPKAATPLNDPFGDQPAAHSEGDAPRPAPSKLAAPAFAQEKSLLTAEPADDPELETPAPRARESFAPSQTEVFDQIDEPRGKKRDEDPLKDKDIVCRDGNAECTKNKARLKRHSLLLTTIPREDFVEKFLDISPPEPQIDRQERPDPVQAAEYVRDRLANVPSRAWTNQKGETVATGKWVGYRNGRVLIGGPDDTPYDKSAERSAAQIPFNSLSDEDRCLVAYFWNLPNECDPHEGVYAGRSFVPSTFTWKASALCHKPLYFEQVQLERYGHSPGPIVEPFTSGAHFFVNIALLPYHMGINPVGECQYSLGYHRPGSCAPWMLPPFPLSLRGAAAEVGAIYGVHALMP